jgi:siroheme synthase
MPQRAINALLVRSGSEGLTVVRLKGGDPFIFGRGSEEMLELGAAGIGGIAPKRAHAGMRAKTPVRAIAEGTTPCERRLLTELGRVVADVAAAQLRGPVLFLIGRVARFPTCPQSP